MPSDIPRNVNFAVMQHAFPGRTPGIQLEVPTAWRFHSLESTSAWIRSLGHPMSVLAFVSIEILDNRLSKRSRELMDRCTDGAPDQLILLAKDSIIGLMDKLLNREKPENDVIEKLDFEILDVVGPGVTAPGIYAEIVHDSDIASSIERWSKDVDGLPGSVIGHVSIEFYRDALLPSVRSIIDAKDHGEPEPLEALIGGEVISIIKQFMTA